MEFDRKCWNLYAHSRVHSIAIKIEWTFKTTINFLSQSIVPAYAVQEHFANEHCIQCGKIPAHHTANLISIMILHPGRARWMINHYLLYSDKIRNKTFACWIIYNTKFQRSEYINKAKSTCKNRLWNSRWIGNSQTKLFAVHLRENTAFVGLLIYREGAQPFIATQAIQQQMGAN